MPTSVTKATTFSFFSFIKFIGRHWQLFTFLIIIIPAVISSFITAFETDNPLYPVLDLGKRIFNADAALYQDVEMLKANPDEIIGMAKPEAGIWQGVKYKWHLFLLGYRLFSSVYLIFFPLMLIYKGFKARNSSETMKNVALAVGLFVLYLFIVNVLFIIYDLVQGTASITVPAGESKYQAVWHIFIQVLPFHGLVNLVVYIVGLFG